MTSAGVPPIISLRGIHKRFGGAAALSAIDLDFPPGEIHGLVGANGAGKSTLGKIMGGVYERDQGEIAVDGESVGKWTTAEALRRGIAMIQQELALVPALTVAENVFLGIEASRLGLLVNNLKQRFGILEDRCGFGLNPDTPVRRLRIADRQKVEIMRALARDARLIVMDEPTSALTRNEADNLHEIIRRLRSEGAAVVYVSHFLDMVLEVSDVVTVLRSGRLIRTGPASAETPASLVEAMTGAPLELAFPVRPPVPGPDAPVLLKIDQLSAGQAVRDVSLIVREGEIVGIAGLVGSGRSELLRAIFGADPITSGRIEVSAHRLNAHSSRSALQSGLAMIPEDRRGQGLVMAMSVRANVTLPHLSAVSMFGVLRRRKEASRVQRTLNAIGVIPSDVDGDLRTYSGGNQQKVLFAKWQFGAPSVMLLDEPTRGVDIASKRAIYQFISDIASSGVGVLLVSSEFEEVLGLSHRVHVMHQGKLIRELDPTRIDHDGLMRAAFNLGAEQLSQAAVGP